MEEKKQSPNKTQKLKVRQDSTLQNVLSQLIFPEEINQYYILILGQAELKDIFIEINTALSQRQQLTQLYIDQESVKQLSFEDSIYQLNHLNQITDLSLKFYGTISFHSHQNYLLGTCLKSFSSLQKLELWLTCDLLKNKENMFKLHDFFKEAPQLQSIDFKFSNVPERSTIFYSLLEGIRFLKSLKSISIKSELSEVKSYVIIDILEDELKDNRSLQELNLELGYKALITNHDFHKINRIMKQLPQLEKFKLLAYSSIKKTFWEDIRLGDDMQTLKNLKQLNLTFENQIHMKYSNLIQTISEMEQLENVILKIYLIHREQINNNLQVFANSLSKIQQLSELSIYFYDDFTLFIIEVIEFISKLYPLQKLTNLSILVGSMVEIQPANVQQDIDIDIETFLQVINKLTKYSFKKNLEWKYQVDDNINKIYESICTSSNLEELELAFHNYYNKSTFVPKQKIKYYDFLSNKTKLKKLNLNFDSHLILEQDQIFTVLNKLQFNKQLQNLSLSIKSELNISYENLKELSSSLIQLKELESLTLNFGSDTQLSDTGIINLANSFRSMKSLNTFFLEFCRDSLSSNTLNEVITNLQYLQKLRSLNLKIFGKQFSSSEEEKSFGDSFIFQPKLNVLEISLIISNLKYKNLENIFKQISSLQRMEYLQLYFSFEIELEDCFKLKKYLSNMQELRMIFLQNFSVQLLHLIKLFDDIVLLTDIEFINDYREMSCLVKATRSIKEYEGNLTEEISLKVQNEKLIMNEVYEKENAETIVPLILNDISHIMELKIYFMADNNVGSQYSSLLFNEMKKLQNLKNLKIHIDYNNSIGTESLNMLGETLLKLPKLKKFQFTLNSDCNNINWDQCSFFSHTLKKLTNLQFLEIVIIFEGDANKNKLFEETICALFNGIQSLTSLDTLEFVINNFQITEKVVQQFDSMCLSLKSNLRNLSALFEGASVESFQQIKQSIRTLENLSCLKLNHDFHQSLFKAKRLVHFKKLEYYYTQYDYM